MSYSFNEATVMIKKATRGAGCSWSLAEEVSYAASCLWQNSLPACEIAVQFLDFVIQAQCTLKTYRPQELHLECWQSAKGVLCPVQSGLVFADCASFMPVRTILFEGFIAAPLFLPFAMRAAKVWKQPLRIKGEGLDVLLDAQQLEVHCFELHGQKMLRLEPWARAPAPKSYAVRANPNSKAWGQLEKMAYKTYAPATEASRLRGAGAGLSDND